MNKVDPTVLDTTVYVFQVEKDPCKVLIPDVLNIIFSHDWMTIKIAKDMMLVSKNWCKVISENWMWEQFAIELFLPFYEVKRSNCKNLVENTIRTMISEAKNCFDKRWSVYGFLNSEMPDDINKIRKTAIDCRLRHNGFKKVANKVEKALAERRKQLYECDDLSNEPREWCDVSFPKAEGIALSLEKELEAKKQNANLDDPMPAMHAQIHLNKFLVCASENLEAEIENDLSFWQIDDLGNWRKKTPSIIISKEAFTKKDEKKHENEEVARKMAEFVSSSYTNNSGAAFNICTTGMDMDSASADALRVLSKAASGSDTPEMDTDNWDDV